MNANAKEWHPPAAVTSTSMVSYSDNNAKDDPVEHCNGETTANHNITRRRRQHQRTRQHRYGKKNVNGNCLNEGKALYTSNNNGINTKEVYHNDSYTHTSIDKGMISTSTQDVHDQSTSTQNHIRSKHQEHQKQKQRRRRRRKGGSDKKGDTTDISYISSTAAAGGGSHRTHKAANHSRRHHKMKANNGSATSEKHPADELFDNESNFPTLNANTTAPSTYDRTATTDDTNWNDSLANKLASIEIEEQQKKQKYLEEQLQLQEDMKESVQLTKLTYNKPLPHNVLDNKEVDGEDQLDDRTETEEKNVQYPTPSTSTETSTHNSSNYYQTIPNTKHKWTNSELTKMRKRWWDAVRAKRRRVEEERLERRRMLDEKERGKALLNSGDGSMKDDNTDDSSSDDNGSNSSSSFSSSDNDSLIHTNSYDPMEPPSLSTTPFDEMTKPNTNTTPRPNTPPIIPYIKPTVSQTILDLEKQSLELDYPLHYVIYIISLKYTNHEIMGNGISIFDNNKEDDERNKSDGEVVLNRLLTMQSDDDVSRWMNLRVGLSILCEFEDEESTPETDHLLSADVNAMTPLQLAIYLNLPSIVRLLYTTSSKALTPSYSSKNSWDEEDEYGRTPLMLACELNHVQCIQTIMCISSPRKLVRREQLGGNTAFHFCCMDRQHHKYKLEGEDDSHDKHHQLAMSASASSQCASAFDMLLRYTPIKDQKRILSTTNYNKQNLLHLACNQGDLQLLEILLDCHTTPGVNVAKALDGKDSLGCTPFVSAVASESTDIIMHLLSTRFAVNSNLWLDSCALIVAVSSRSVEMVKLLLDSCYGSSSPGGQVRSEVNRALLETVYEYGEEKDSTNRTHQDDTTHEIIQLLITEGGANPHLPSMIQYPGYTRSLSEYDGEIHEETPLTAAVRAADPVAIKYMMNAYFISLHEAKQERRRDPILAQQPESYFRVLEEKEDDIIHSSIDAALVASLFLLRYTGNLDYGKCGLVLYEQSADQNLSQQGLQWLEKCISTGRLIPTIPQGITSASDESFEVSLIRYHIPSCRGEKKSKSINDTCSSHTDMDWSYVLTTLPWFKTRMNGVNCNWLKRAMLDSKLQEVDYQGAVKDDEFDLAVEGGVKLCAHRSIVSARCGKLAAQIRFTERHSSQGGRLTVHVDLPQLVAKMLLSHIYHGSVSFGLRGSPTEQCQQLLELALLAEEYLCPSLLLECELRLLERSSCTLCICPQCSGGKQLSTNHVSTTDQVVHRAELQYLEKVKDNLNESISMFCQPIGVHIYKSSVVSSNSRSIITAQNSLDILAVAQQLECSQFNQQSLYHLKYNRPSSTSSTHNGSSNSSLSNLFDHISLQGEPNKDGATTQPTKKIPIMGNDNNDTEYMSVPFAAVKSMAVRSMLSNFPVVLKSESYARQCKDNSHQEEADMDEIDESFTSQADKNENGVLLLQACLEEL